MQEPTSKPPLYEIRDTPHHGRAVFATSSMVASTHLLTCSDLTLSVLLREYRREVCGQCFNYAHGRDWRIRDSTTGFVFCAEACREQWRKETGHVGIQAWTAVETLISKRTKEDSDLVDVDMPRPAALDITTAWDGVAAQAALIRIARGGKGGFPNAAGSGSDDTDAGVQVTKQHKRAIQKALQQPISPDVMSFCVTGVLWLHNNPASLPALLHLEADTTPYPNALDLVAFTRSYLHLLAILPLPLLPLLTPANLMLLSSRDSHNAFGIRSLEDDGAEFFGYGCWPQASYFNHSCDPSVKKTRVGRTWRFEAARHVEEGEELSITYLSTEERSQERASRMGILRKNWGFECGCVKCIEGVEAP
ncbi:SET domain-containing protein [Pleomassaria siparia CBS 279.74]|uniref:SET domain-containing protein n=1 Tax=Pleomassaria siparia CBS 279.74 TaxID=1314801 RepID=A0A6G1K5J9_9PLEO|nr:SET domain-containing protein [Pleomassaria siparia CBS 279.74]